MEEERESKELGMCRESLMVAIDVLGGELQRGKGEEEVACEWEVLVGFWVLDG